MTNSIEARNLTGRTIVTPDGDEAPTTYICTGCTAEVAILDQPSHLEAECATTRRPATDSEMAATAHLPAFRQVVTVEENSDGRATVGRAATVHRATITTYFNSFEEAVSSIASVGCGAERYRGGRSAAAATSSRHDVDCARCLAE